MKSKVIYAYQKRNGIYYYIGKGYPDRPYRKHNHGLANKPTDRSRIIILHEGLDDETAKDWEKKLILFYGRKDLGTGQLLNLTDGGEGTNGRIASPKVKAPKTPEHRRKIGDSNRGVSRQSKPKECPHCHRLIKPSNFQAHVNTHLGIKNNSVIHTEETKQRLAALAKKRNQIKKECPNCHSFLDLPNFDRHYLSKKCYTLSGDYFRKMATD